MDISNKHAAYLSVASQISTRAINLILSISFVRFAPANSVGYFTLLITGAQLVSSLGRVGTNYSYTTILPTLGSKYLKLQLTNTYANFGIIASFLVSAIIITQVGNTLHTESIDPSINPDAFLILGVIYLFGDGISELLWSIHLANGRFKAVFFRDVWLALSKGIFPLMGALIYGVIGVAAGLCISSMINNSIALLIFIGNKGANNRVWWSLGSIKYLLKLLEKGIPFFSVPLVSNLILWPLLLKIVSNEGVNSLDGLRVAQICAQIITVISASLMPILLIRSSQNKNSADDIHQKSFQVCWLISTIIYSVYALSDKYVLPLIFGEGPAQGALLIARIAVAAAAIQGLSQIPMQRPFGTHMLIKLAVLQIFSLVVAGIISIYILLPINGLVAYTSINLLSPFITVMCLPIILNKQLGIPDSSTQIQLLFSLILIMTSYLNINSTLEMFGIIGCLIGSLLINRRFIDSLLMRLPTGG